MTWLFDDALHVPGSMAEAGRWLLSNDSPPLGPPVVVDGYAKSLDWTRLLSVHAFWDEEGRGSMTRSVANLCSGLWRRDTELVASVQRDGDELAVFFGVSRDAGPRAGRVSEALFYSALQGATFASVAAPARAAMARRLFRAGAAMAVVGTPRAMSAPKDRPLIEVLAEARLDRWSLTIEAAPVDFADLAARVVAFDTLLTQLGEESSVTRRVDETRTVTSRDAAREQLSTMLKRERERAEQSLRRGGFRVTAWLTADDADTLEAATGVVAGTLSPSRLEPRGLALIGGQRGGGAAGSFLVADEVASLVQPPIHDVRGFRVTEWSRFDAQPEAHAGASGPTVSLGEALTGAPLAYPMSRLTSHALVTGITGSGKSSFLCALLGGLTSARPAVPYLVIEPTKDEYRALVPATSLWAVGDPAGVGRHRLNPFEVHPKTPVQTHLDVLVALFTSSFSLISPLPFVLELAIRRAYEDRGWDLGTNANPFLDADPAFPAFPCFSEVIAAAEHVVEDLGYQGEVRHNVRGALRARLGAMTVGLKGAAFDTDRPTDFASYLDRPFVVNLDLVGSDEEKAFIIGLLVVRLWEERRGTSSGDLRHLLVLEEAHRILKKDQGRSSDERSGAAFASEMFGNLLAEIRSAGQGVAIVDQSPRKLSSDALANTALKVAFRATYEEDKKELAAALNLDEAQQRALTGMATHQAAVFWEGMDRPVAARMSAAWPRPAAASPAALSGSRIKTKARPAPAGAASGSRVAGRARRSAVAVRRTPGTDRLALLWLVAPPAERPAIVAEADRLTRPLVPTGVSTAAAFESAVSSALERLGQARRWTPARRDDLLTGVRGLPAGEKAVRGALLDGSRPLRACVRICPLQACLARDLVRPVVGTFRLDPLTTDWPRYTREELRMIFETELGAAGRPSLSPSIAAVARRCFVAHALEDRIPDVDVEATDELLR